MDCITYKPLLYWIWSLVTFCISIIYSVNSTAFPFLNIRNELFMLLIFCSIISSKSEFYQKLWFSKKADLRTTVKLTWKHHYWIGNKNWLGKIIISFELQLRTWKYHFQFGNITLLFQPNYWSVNSKASNWKNNVSELIAMFPSEFSFLN